MTSPSYVFVIDVICGIAGAMVIAPLVLYLSRPWTARRDNLFSILGEETLMQYYKRFHPESKPIQREVKAIFRRDFNRNYGRRHYLFPIALLALLTGVTAVAAAQTLMASQQIGSHPY